MGDASHGGSVDQVWLDMQREEALVAAKIRCGHRRSDAAVLKRWSPASVGSDGNKRKRDESMAQKHDTTPPPTKRPHSLHPLLGSGDAVQEGFDPQRLPTPAQVPSPGSGLLERLALH